MNSTSVTPVIDEQCSEFLLSLILMYC